VHESVRPPPRSTVRRPELEERARAVRRPGREPSRGSDQGARQLRGERFRARVSPDRPTASSSGIRARGAGGAGPGAARRGAGPAGRGAADGRRRPRPGHGRRRAGV